jgi:hypothetical protein
LNPPMGAEQGQKSQIFQGSFVPARKEQPKTSKILDSIDPSI